MSKEILVVEDNPDNMKLITWVLEDEAYQVTGVENAEDGIKLLKERSFDLVLMDIDLPGIDGEEATRILRAQEEFRHLPIIALTAHALKEEVERIMSCGFTALATKPIDEEAIVQMIANYMEGKHGESTRC